MASDSKTVFALRKEGRLEEALTLARALYDSPQVDVWAVRALAWVLVDLTKAALCENNRAAAGEYFQELAELTVAPDDTILHDQREWLRQQVAPGGEILMQARSAAKDGHQQQALALYRTAVKSLPESREAQTGLGWVIERLLKEEAGKPGPDRAHVISLFREYLGLALVEKPSVLHSLILTRAIQLQGCLENLYVSFIRKWDPQFLRAEDFQPYQPEGKDETYPSLAEKAGMALGKAIKGLRRDALPAGVDPAWISGWLGELAGRFPEQVWLQYHHAKSLLLAGSPEAARLEILPIVRIKQSEFWAWAVLADTYAQGSRERLACLCRAMGCHVQDAVYLKGVVRNLKGALAAAGEREAAASLELPQGQAVTDGILRQLAPVLGKYAPAADSLAFGDLPWVEAVVSRREEPGANIKGRVFLLARAGNGLQEIRTGMRTFACLGKASAGAPVAVRLVTVDQRPKVVDARLREGAAWDLVPERTGVVKHVNGDKGLAAIAVGVDVTALAYFDRFPAARGWAPGTPVLARCLNGREENLPILVAVRPAESLPASTFCRSFAGSLERLEGGGAGFVGDTYVPAALIAGIPTATMSVEGISVLETNHKNGKRGWRAVTLRSNP